MPGQNDGFFAHLANVDGNMCHKICATAARKFASRHLHFLFIPSIHSHSIPIHFYSVPPFSFPSRILPPDCLIPLPIRCSRPFPFSSNSRPPNPSKKSAPFSPTHSQQFPFLVGPRPHGLPSFPHFPLIFRQTCPLRPSLSGPLFIANNNIFCSGWLLKCQFFWEILHFLRIICAIIILKILRKVCPQLFEVKIKFNWLKIGQKWRELFVPPSDPYIEFSLQSFNCSPLPNSISITTQKRPKIEAKLRISILTFFERPNSPRSTIQICKFKLNFSAGKIHSNE